MAGAHDDVPGNTRYQYLVRVIVRLNVTPPAGPVCFDATMCPTPVEVAVRHNWMICPATEQLGSVVESLPLKTAADIVLNCMRNVAAEMMAALPTDGASEHDHYIYGWPKRQA